MTMQIHLDSEIFEQVKNGTKTIEARVNDEKRRLIREDQIIEVLKRPDEVEALLVRVTSKRTFENFEELVNTYPIEKLYSPNYTKEQYLALFPKFYTQEEINQYGVVAIHFEVIEDPDARKIQRIARNAIVLSVIASVLNIVYGVFSLSLGANMVLFASILSTVAEIFLSIIIFHIAKGYINTSAAHRKAVTANHPRALLVMAIMAPVIFLLPHWTFASLMADSMSGVAMDALGIMIYMYAYMISFILYLIANTVFPIIILAAIKRLVADDHLQKLQIDL